MDLIVDEPPPGSTELIDAPPPGKLRVIVQPPATCDQGGLRSPVTLQVGLADDGPATQQVKHNPSCPLSHGNRLPSRSRIPAWLFRPLLPNVSVISPPQTNVQVSVGLYIAGDNRSGHTVFCPAPEDIRRKFSGLVMHRMQAREWHGRVDAQLASAVPADEMKMGAHDRADEDSMLCYDSI